MKKEARVKIFVKKFDSFITGGEAIRKLANEIEIPMESCDIYGGGADSFGKAQPVFGLIYDVKDEGKIETLRKHGWAQKGESRKV